MNLGQLIGELTRYGEIRREVSAPAARCSCGWPRNACSHEATDCVLAPTSKGTPTHEIADGPEAGRRRGRPGLRDAEVEAFLRARGASSFTAISDGTGIESSHLGHLLSRMEGRSLIVKVRRGVYDLPEAKS